MSGADDLQYQRNWELRRDICSAVGIEESRYRPDGGTQSGGDA